MGGFSPHAGVAVRANQRNEREQLCRYISRRAVSERRLSLTVGGKVRYQLKTPYNNGTTHVVFEPLDFLARLAALVPRPRVNLTRYHGVFVPNSAHRALFTRAGRGKSREGVARAESRTPAERRAAMRIIACIEDPAVIKAILAHLADKTRPVHAPRSPPGWAPPASAFS